MPDVVFINGRFVPWQDATVSIDDRGFQFGDAVYEVVRSISRLPEGWLLGNTPSPLRTAPRS
jgi:D-alanine transaminase